jgi:putative phage-type endonuclease
MASIVIKDEAHWHEVRSKHIGGSEIAALFGLSTFTSKWQLWMEKSGRIPPEDISGNKAVQAGTFLESGIASWAAHRWGMAVSKVADYYAADDTPGMGASFDFITTEGHPVEIKWSSSFVSHWEYEGDTIIDAPEAYILQVQHQLACTDAEYGWLIGLIRDEPRRMKIPRNDNIIGAIKGEVAAFWKSIEDGVEPEPDLNVDGDAIARLMEVTPITDITLGAEHEHLFVDYLAHADVEKTAKAVKEAKKAELLLLLRAEMEKYNRSPDTDKAKVTCGGRKLSLSNVKGNPGVTVTEDMLGTVINKRSGYQRVTIS